MPKKREPVDAFGLSLLDVLSNALGGLILLMLIVAVTLKGNDKRRLNLPEEERQGQKYTELEFQKKKPEVKFNLLLVQITLYGSDASLEFEGDRSNCSLTKSTANGNKESEDWFILRIGEKEKDWSVTYAQNAFDNIRYPDSIAVFVTIDEMVYCAEIFNNIDKNAPVLEVKESKSENIDIKIGGKTPSYLN